MRRMTDWVFDPMAATHPRTEQEERVARAESQRALARFAEMLRMGRKLQQVSQAEFAKALQISRRTLQRMEQGDGTVGVSTWLRAMQSLGVLRRIHDAVRPSDEMIAESVRTVASRAARRRAGTDAPTSSTDFPRPERRGD